MKRLFSAVQPLPLQVSRRIARTGLRLAGLAASCCSLIGCTVLTSELPSVLEQEGRAPEGVYYNLPKTVIDLTLSVDQANATFELAPSNGRTIADTGYRYYLRHVPLPNYHDKITVTLYPQKSLLKSIDVDTEDETVDIIENLAKLAGALNPGLVESASSKGDVTKLIKITIDPANEDEVAGAAKRLNAEVRAYAQTQSDTLCRQSEEDQKAGFILNVQRRAQCDAYRAVLGRPRHIALAFEPLHGFASRCKTSTASHHEEREHRTRPRMTAAPKRADCSVGICYRPVRPHELCIKVDGAVSRTIYEVPNASDPVEIDIRRAMLVQKTQSIQFGDDGALERMSVRKDSELLALSSLPLVVIKGLADGVQLRLTIVQNQVKLGTAEKNLAAARTKLEKQRQLLEAAAAASEARVITSGISAVPQMPQIGAPVTQSGSTPFDKLPQLN